MLLNGLFGLCLVLVPVLPSTTSVSSTDFSGTWKIDKTSSTYQRLNGFDDLTFVVTQTAQAVNVKRVIKQKNQKEKVNELTLYPDGRGEKVSLLMTNQKWDSKTTWVNGNLVTRFTVTVYESTSSDYIRYDYKDTWSLSKDGNHSTERATVCRGSYRQPDLQQGLSAHFLIRDTL